MAKLYLNFLRKSPQVLGTDVVYYERIKAFLAIGNAGQIRWDAIVDTGSFLSVFPEKRWRIFEPDITWICPPGSSVLLPDWLGKVTGIGAPAVDCGIGKMKIQIMEIPGG